MAGDPCPKPEPRAPKKPRRINPVSKKRRIDWAEREHVRRVVLLRDGGCVGPSKGLPGPCGWLPGRQQLEVHETTPRGRDSTSWLNPDRCHALCPRCHEFCTSAYGDRLEVVRAAGLDVKAAPLPSLPNLKEGA